MAAYDQCFDIVVNTEGGLTKNPADPGNWTGGKVNAGELKGTKWGISAAAYPAVDIEALTKDDAKAIYRRDYWDRLQLDHVPPPLALILFDSEVNSGPGRAVGWLQAALGVKATGRLDQPTMNALDARKGGGAVLCAEVLALRIVFDAGLPTWKTFGHGWARRLASLPFQSFTLLGA